MTSTRSTTETLTVDYYGDRYEIDANVSESTRDSDGKRYASVSIPVLALQGGGTKVHPSFLTISIDPENVDARIAEPFDLSRAGYVHVHNRNNGRVVALGHYDDEIPTESYCGTYPDEGENRNWTARRSVPTGGPRPVEETPEPEAETSDDEITVEVATAELARRDHNRAAKRNPDLDRIEAENDAAFAASKADLVAIVEAGA